MFNAIGNLRIRRVAVPFFEILGGLLRPGNNLGISIDSQPYMGCSTSRLRLFPGQRSGDLQLDGCSSIYSPGNRRPLISKNAGSFEKYGIDYPWEFVMIEYLLTE
ncbi:hypothetical protein PAAG_12258 [Paracoccidioides lutzii Pb01]|uniref:Uncharacterized protein n=1 Tax=Paracoccidioides lutzii (strain ATCC MYA-826 / Pb01) TaxID=502779 RepID=A0A0A2VJJ9_PARBA|nr:hypothetical protein PAAG_12258 [Paracoccidioides lutzii Pb01]KGQ01064.1 hypothetical protein PAAG_12258 [Paracoccidioides lutzii Pb01]